MNKQDTITKLFEGKEIRSVWDSEKEDYYFSVVDVIGAITDSSRPRKYWNDLKINLLNEGSKLSEKIGQLKLIAKDGKYYSTDVLDTEGILRLIESVPSPKAEPFKMWLARLGKERIDETFDPEIALNRIVASYKRKGMSDEWIKKRLDAVLDRNKLTDAWKETGVTEGYEFASLTNEMYKVWSGMTSKEYKDFKGLRKESLRDNMDEIEVLLTNVSETTTRKLVEEKNPFGYKENKELAIRGGNVAKITRENIEKELGKPVIVPTNNLNYQYVKEDLLEERNDK